MHGNLPAPRADAIDAAVRTVAQTGSHKPDKESQTGSEGFAAACSAILGKDAGLHLHRITGFPERSCYRYAAGERMPPFDFLRTLFHSDHGGPFFAAFMSNCTAPWWLDQQRKLRNADKLDAARFE